MKWLVKLVRKMLGYAEPKPAKTSVLDDIDLDHCELVNGMLLPTLKWED